MILIFEFNHINYWGWIVWMILIVGMMGAVSWGWLEMDGKLKMNEGEDGWSVRARRWWFDWCEWMWTIESLKMNADDWIVWMIFGCCSVGSGRLGMIEDGWWVENACGWGWLMVDLIEAFILIEAFNWMLQLNISVVLNFLFMALFSQMSSSKLTSFKETHFIQMNK